MLEVPDNVFRAVARTGGGSGCPWLLSMSWPQSKSYLGMFNVAGAVQDCADLVRPVRRTSGGSNGRVSSQRSRTPLR